MNKLRYVGRVMAFTLAPMMTDASGWKLGILSCLVALGAVLGWPDMWEDR